MSAAVYIHSILYVGLWPLQAMKLAREQQRAIATPARTRTFVPSEGVGTVVSDGTAGPEDATIPVTQA